MLEVFLLKLLLLLLLLLLKLNFHPVAVVLTLVQTKQVRIKGLNVFEDGPDRGFRNVGQYKSDAGDTPKKKLKQLILNTAKV
jgi:hypothetical protein